MHRAGRVGQGIVYACNSMGEYVPLIRRSKSSRRFNAPDRGANAVHFGFKVQKFFIGPVRRTAIRITDLRHLKITLRHAPIYQPGCSLTVPTT